ncbi:MAG: universal stress protein [Desulfobacteraceae bacterium]|nr:universal stress protein [Desulfobacteraceae bacterium]
MADTTGKKENRRTKSALYNHILLATDGSESAKKAEENALLMAKANGARLTVVHVMDDSLCHYGRIDTLVPAGAGEDFNHYVISEQESEARKVIRRFTVLAESSGVNFDLSVRLGNPVTEIAAVSDELSSDLVIIGGKKNPGVRGVKFTGTADKVAAECRCSIMIII